ncbi:MAG: alkaline phosphatase family protein [Agromyces sp.]
MSPMLPSRSPDSVRLAEVLASSFAAVMGEPNRLDLPAVDSAIVLVVDGLGMHNLAARAGHARTMTSAASGRSVAWTTFPSTTAAALTTLTTGVEPGIHGVVGYSVFDRSQHRVLNQLSDWGAAMPADTWQRAQTVFETASARGVRADVVGHPKYANSGFTNASLRGSSYHEATTIQERLDWAAARSVTPGISYVYVAELDMAAHANGWESDTWLARLEEVDAAVRTVLPRLSRRTGLIVTADHGVIDVAIRRHVLIDSRAPELAQQLHAVAGDPRALSLWLDAEATERERSELASAWQAVLGDDVWALSREQAIANGLFGSRVDEAVEPRIGDVILAARKGIALYDSRTASAQSRAMIGQHGSLSDEEQRVPLLRFGAFA